MENLHTNVRFAVRGMSCASCSAHVEKAVSQVEGVTEVSVNLLTNSMLVSFQEPATEEKIIQATEKAGYGASLEDFSLERGTREKEEEALKDKQTPHLLKRLISSLALLIPLFYFSMGYMLGWNIGAIADNPLSVGLLLMLLSLSIMLINYEFFTSGFRSLFHLTPNMDSLVALGSSIAFVYSVVLMFSMGNYAISGDMEALKKTSMSLAFETAGMVPSLITIGKTLESYSKGKTTDAIKKLIDLAPKQATLIQGGQEKVILADQLKEGDVFLVRPGESFPGDGIVIEGESAVDESGLTGEAIPNDKKKGSRVFCGTMNQSGALKCTLTASGSKTTLNQIVQMVQQAAGTKTHISSLADKISGIFVPVVLSISLIVFLAWMLFGGDFVRGLNDSNITLVSYALQRGISVLVISCPCALGLATPVAIMVGNGLGAKKGILFKTAAALEETGKADFAVLDKTGTLTKGKMEVSDEVSFDSSFDLLSLAASLEIKSEHPLGKAIALKGKLGNAEIKECTSFQALSGYGAIGLIDGKRIIGGNYALLEKEGLQNENFRQKADCFASEGKTPVFFAYDGKVIGLVALSDALKDDSVQAVKELKELGIIPVMLTGDNRLTAEAIGKKAGIDYVVSDLFPQGKQEIIKSLQKYGKVLMIGDGINDSPSLTQADIGMAIGAGSDIAIDSADVVLLKSSLKDAVGAIRLSRQTLNNIKENLFWAFFYNLIMIPIAAGALSFTGIYNLKPWYGAAAMSLSSFTVVLNALRLNLFNPYKEKRSGKKIVAFDPSILVSNSACKAESEETKQRLSIEGMMCQHCVSRVKEAIESVKGVSGVEVYLEGKEAKYIAGKEVKKEAIIKAVEESGYKAE